MSDNTLASRIAELDLAEVVVALHTADPGGGDMAGNGRLVCLLLQAEFFATTYPFPG